MKALSSPHVEILPMPDKVVEPPRSIRKHAAGAEGVGLMGLGIFAVGAVTFGALAIGALAIGRLVIGRTKLKSVEVEDLTIGRIIVHDLRLPDHHPDAHD
ncbi:MAG: hypothetical protein HONBIEJF_01891 [Fimbriimonadaceae bacterium]|nr:hypothetical protein [Fimbriimonadaceae bacterium]